MWLLDLLSCYAKSDAVPSLNLTFDKFNWIPPENVVES